MKSKVILSSNEINLLVEALEFYVNDLTDFRPETPDEEAEAATYPETIYKANSLVAKLKDHPVVRR